MANRKVLHIVTSLDIGGAQSVIVNMCNALVETTDWEANVIPLGGSSTMSHRFFSKVNVYSPIMHRRILFLRSIFRLCRIVCTIRPDVLHLHLWSPKLLGVICGSICRVPVIISTEHSGYPWTKPVRKYIDTVLSHWIMRRIMVCEYISKKFIDSGVCNSNQAVVLYNPVPLPSVDRIQNREQAKGNLSIFNGTIVFLFVGALRKVKNLSRLLSSFAEYISKPGSINSTLIIVGNGPELTSLQAQVKRLGITQSVRFELEQDYLYDYYSAADIFLMTSEVEGFSIALAEAMHFGIASICVASGGTSEMILEGQTGLLLDRIDSSKDADALMKLACSHVLRNELGSRAKEMIRGMTSPERYTSNLISIYEHLAESNG